MNVSTHTLELDPAVMWRLVGTHPKVAPRPSTPAISWPAGCGAMDEPATAVAGAEPERRRPAIGDALEFGCVVTTLAAIWLLQLGLFANLA